MDSYLYDIVSTVSDKRVEFAGMQVATSPEKAMEKYLSEMQLMYSWANQGPVKVVMAPLPFNLRHMFTGKIPDELAEKIGAVIARDFRLKRSREHPDRWETENGTFTNKGIARRAARHFLETK